MKITRVNFKEKNNNGSLATCSVVLDDCLMLSEISLYKGDKGYYLILPSKQDVYKSIKDLNKGISIEYPVNSKNCEGGKKVYEEFFHPVTNSFYNELLSEILVGYNICIVNKKGLSYRP